MSHSSSYDTAFNLCHTLRLYHKKFSVDDDVIIYPSSWYDKFFEITFRDKNNSDENHPINVPELMEILNVYVPEGWDYMTLLDREKYATPIKLQFKFKSFME